MLSVFLKTSAACSFQQENKYWLVGENTKKNWAVVICECSKYKFIKVISYSKEAVVSSDSSNY